jgi:hypothetical protein
VGSRGTQPEVVSVAFPESGKGAQIFQGDAKTAAAALVENPLST